MVNTMTDFRALCAELLAFEYVCSEYKVPLQAALRKARKALFQPEPQGPTLDDVSELCEEFGFHLDESYDNLESAEALWEMFRAVLARWGRPAIEPVPVSERPWEREGWCDADGRCWFGAPPDGAADAGWILRKPSERLSHQTASLPHHALPVPQQEANDD
jgi:hypothetical protein